MAGETDRVARLMLRIEASKQEAAAARKTLESVRADLRSIETQTITVAQAQARMGKAFQDIARERALDKVVADFRKTEGLAHSTSRAIEITAQKLAALGASEDEINRVTRALAKMSEAQGQAGKGGGQGSLGSIGSQIRGLPSIQIAGGITTDAVGNILRVSDKVFNKMGGDITKLGAAAGVTGLAVVAIALAMEQFNRIIDEAKAKLAGAISAQNAYYEALASKTTEQVTQELATLNRRRATLEAQAAEAQAALDSAWKQAVAQFGDAGARAVFASGAFGDLQEQVDSTKKALEDNVQTSTRYRQGLEQNVFAANDAAAAEERLAKARTDANIAAAKEAGDNIRQFAKSMELTSEQAVDRIKELDVENQAIRASIASLRASGDTSEQATRALEDYQTQQEKLNQEHDNLTRLLATTIPQREAENAALEESKQQHEDTIAAVKKYNDETAKIESQSAEKRAALQAKFNDTLTQIAEKAADAAADALKKLEEKRADLQTDLVRDEASNQRKAAFDALNRQIEFQRDDAKAAREHQRDLLKIRQDAQRREQELIDARDFAGLFDQRRQTTEAIQDATRKYQEDRAERLLAFQQENEDKAAQFIFDRQQRLIQYGQALQDAAAQYQRERAQIEAQRRDALNKANAAYRNDLDQLQAKYQSELNLRRSAVQAELQLIAQGGQARVQAEAQIQQALLAQARSLLASITRPQTAGGGRAIATRAGGGGLVAGQTALVNDAFRGQREGFNGFQFPAGLGLFTPLQSGTVSAGRGAITLNMPVNIQSGNSPAQNQALVQAIRRTVVDVLEQVTQ